ncbi:MAG: hypothetical protein KBT46_09665 [Ruminococcus sp.]|nr:hypothetical protein [Candidatus Copronaster equi]
MKKIISFLISLTMIVVLAIPALAADTIKFNITLVSENDTQAVITVDYAGGPSFNSLDFELSFSKKLILENAVKSDGLKKFQDAVEESGSMMVALVNKDTNPAKVAVATVTNFKPDYGKDLFKFTFKKLSKGKLTANDIKINVTNCGLSESAGKTKELSAVVSSDLGKAITSSINTTQANKVTSVSSVQNNAENSTTASSVISETQTTESVTEEITNVIQETEKGNKVEDKIVEVAKSPEKRKIVVIALVAACLLLIIIALIIIFAKKSKKSDSKDESTE